MLGRDAIGSLLSLCLVPNSSLAEPDELVLALLDVVEREADKVSVGFGGIARIDSVHHVAFAVTAGLRVATKSNEFVFTLLEIVHAHVAASSAESDHAALALAEPHIGTPLIRPLLVNVERLALDNDDEQNTCERSLQR